MAGLNCLCKRARYFFSFSRNVFRSETVHLLLRIILESFKLHYFFLTSITCDPNDGITARGCAGMSPKETVVVFVQCFYTDLGKTSISNFLRVGTAFSSANFLKPGPFCSSAATLARFFRVEIVCFVGESNTKFARHIACCACSAV